MTPVEAPTKIMKMKFILISRTKEKNIDKPKFQLGQLVRTNDFKSVFTKVDSTNYSYVLYTSIKIIHDTIPQLELTF